MNPPLSTFAMMLGSATSSYRSVAALGTRWATSEMMLAIPARRG